MRRALAWPGESSRTRRHARSAPAWSCKRSEKTLPSFWRTRSRAVASVVSSARFSRAFGDRDEVLVAFGLLLEGVERAHVVRILAEDLLVEACRVGAAIEAIGRHARHLGENCTPLGARQATRLELVEIEERTIGTPLRVELLELLDRLAIVGQRLAQALVAPRPRSARWRTDRASDERWRDRVRPLLRRRSRARRGASAW